MATNKNITMKQFNGVDYDTLYPKTKVEQVEGAYTQQQILSDLTKTLFGLETGAVPDEAFVALKNLISGLTADDVGAAKIATGSYTGTGTYGKSAKNSLTFDFDPKIVFIKLDSSINAGGYTILGVFVPRNEYAINILHNEHSSLSLYVTYSNKTMSWYNGVSAEAQANASGNQYYYVAIG